MNNIAWKISYKTPVVELFVRSTFVLATKTIAGVMNTKTRQYVMAM